MIAYILKRLLLIIPTLLAIMTINFFLIQSAPGGPIEQMMAKINNAQSKETQGLVKDRAYRASQGLESDLLENLKKLYGFDKPIGERYLLMLKKYLQFDFGESFYRQIKVIDLIKEKLPVSISLGLFSTLLIYLISIPLGIFKAKRNNEPLDVLSSVVIIVANAIPAFLFAVVLIVFFAGGNYWHWFPLKGLVSDNFESLSALGKIKDYLWHITLPVLCISLGVLQALRF